MKELEELINKAEAEGFWLRSIIDPDIVFTPKRLRHENAHGCFRWGPTNWVLVKPEEEIKRREDYIENRKILHEAFLRRMQQET